MSNIAELQSMLEMPLADQNQWPGNVRGFGSRVVEWAQTGLESLTYSLPRLALAASVAVAGTYALAKSGAEYSSKGQLVGLEQPYGSGDTFALALPEAPQIAKVLHRNTSLTTQTVINRIHRTINAGDGDGTKYGKIVPTSANLHPSSGGFTTDCSNHYAVIQYRRYEVNTGGITFKTCGPFHPMEDKTKPGQFQKPLNWQGGSIRKAVGLHYSESTKVISGPRKKVTVVYKCPASGKGVEKIVLTRAYDGHGKQYSKAAITPCIIP